jgi:hypothetical protein
MPETIVQLLCSACGKPAVIYYTESRMAYCDRHRPSGLCLDTSHREERERLVRQREIAEAERDKARAEADALKATGADSASSLSSLFARHQKAALDLYDAIYRQAEAVVGAVDGGPLAQVEVLVNEIRGLRAQLSATVAERDALMSLIVQPWARDGDGGGDGNSTQLWKVNLAWWDTATSREEGVAMVRKAAGLEAKP